MCRTGKAAVLKTAGRKPLQVRVLSPPPIRISQDKLSKLADIAYNVIVKIESGATPNPTIETMAKIAKGLGVSIDDLMK